MPSDMLGSPAACDAIADWYDQNVRAQSILAADDSIEAVLFELMNALGIVYHRGDAQDLPEVSGSPFDGVLCSMALMDIPDLRAALFGAARLLKGGGWFVASLTHPCFQIPPNRNYHEEGFWHSDNPNGVRGQVGAQHRTLAPYLNGLAEAGLCVERLIEPMLSGRDTPPLLLLRCRKSDC